MLPHACPRDFEWIYVMMAGWRGGEGYGQGEEPLVISGSSCIWIVSPPPHSGYLISIPCHMKSNKANTPKPLSKLFPERRISGKVSFFPNQEDLVFSTKVLCNKVSNPLGGPTASILASQWISRFYFYGHRRQTFAQLLYMAMLSISSKYYPS